MQCRSVKRVQGLKTQILYSDCAGWSLIDGAVDGRQPAEPRGEPALQVSVYKPAAAGPLWLWGTDPALLRNLQTCLLPSECVYFYVCVG